MFALFAQFAQFAVTLSRRRGHNQRPRYNKSRYRKCYNTFASSADRGRNYDWPFSYTFCMLHCVMHIPCLPDSTARHSRPSDSSPPGTAIDALLIYTFARTLPTCLNRPSAATTRQTLNSTRMKKARAPNNSVVLPALKHDAEVPADGAYLNWIGNCHRASGLDHGIRPPRT